MEEIYAKSGPDWTPLSIHLTQVAMSARVFAQHLGFDGDIAYNGGLLHDIGKAHPFFQDRLLLKTNSHEIFRHEIASLFFLSAFSKDEWPALIEMVVGHHKSVKSDIAGLGLLDLEENDDYLDFHIGNWEQWSLDAIVILNELGVHCEKISKMEAMTSLGFCIDYCYKEVKHNGYSEWRGLLMAADHFASSLINKTEYQTQRVFKVPDLSFYYRQNPLYPLSLKDSSSPKRHTIVLASTGAGKTDFLLRRCKGRVFYTLPFQASINAMYKRIGHDLERDNPDIDIRLLHSTSIIIKRKKEEETALQNLVGASVKILTPHQLASLAFGMKGYESLILDLRGCDVILDEVHTYSGVSQALVLKIVEVLREIDCRIHVGTATMPTILYQRIKDILGDNVLEVKLSKGELDQFDRHIVHKIESFESAGGIIASAVENNQKLLIVCNRVKTAQDVYENVSGTYPDIPTLLLHSRFKRGDRNAKERTLLGMDELGRATNKFNAGDGACIVVSTQVVEVSLDISFDIMITECAPLDALIQRFGRINRKRTIANIGHYKDVFVIAPNEEKKDCKPYDWDYLKRSYEALDDGAVLRERDLQGKMDTVFTDLNLTEIDKFCVFKSASGFKIGKLTHRGKAVLFDLLKIDSAVCILESDISEYEEGDFKTRLSLEIPVHYSYVLNMAQSKKGNKPFIVPETAYSSTVGLRKSEIKEQNFNTLNRFL